jgi:membrane protein YdbS with pleckstrin-like domain
MSGRVLWREGEVRVISVTPVSRGVIRPFLITLTTLALIIEAAGRYTLIHRAEDWLVVICVLPLAAVTLTRTWRWRSHKLHVTNERLIIEGGVMRHQRTVIEMRDVIATRIDQRMSERLTRRGYVYVETMAGPVLLGQVRHPGALCRLIDSERLGGESLTDPFDTIYTYEDDEPHQFEVQPDQWRRGRYE